MTDTEARVARAICEASPLFKSGWDEQQPVEKAIWLNVARAAIAAMPEWRSVRYEDIDNAASLIEAQAARIAVLEEALRDCVEAWDWWRVDTYDSCLSVPADAIRAARAALGEKP